MARLKALPSLDIISGFRGVIDYYIYYPSCPAKTGVAGTPCARRWPRSPGRRRSPAVEEQWAAFTKASQYWTQLTPEIQDAYNKMASGTGLSGRDMFTRGYISGLYRYETA
ncbi:hypothetical protein ES703_67292 [subsurface metagenome]